MNKQITVADLIAQFIKLRDTMAAEQAGFDKHMQPYKDGMTAIEQAITAALLALDNDEGKRNISIPGVGVAFRQQWTSATVADGDTFFDFVIDNNERQLLTLHVAKDAVKEYMETHNGTLPPGVDWAHGWKTKIRKG